MALCLLYRINETLPIRFSICVGRYQDDIFSKEHQNNLRSLKGESGGQNWQFQMMTRTSCV